MRLARFADGAYYVPGGELLWLDVEGHGSVGVRSREPYLHTDGTLEPGVLESPVRTDIRLTRYPDEPLTVRPIVCEECGDTGQGMDTEWCQSCHGLGDELNLRTCTYCGEIQYYPAPPLPCAPRETLNHEFLLQRMHPRCAVESTVAYVRGTVTA